MQADLFKCSFCSEPYDLELHIPKVLVSCSHYLCLNCLKNTFINPSPHERQCPSCNTSFLSSIDAPEDFPTDSTLLQLLQSRPKTKPEDRLEIDEKQPLDVKQKDGVEELFQDSVLKKLKTEQEIDDKLVKLQDSIKKQFIERRKMIKRGTSQDSLSPENTEKSIRVKREASKPLRTNRLDISLDPDDDDDEDCLALKPKAKDKILRDDKEVKNHKMEIEEGESQLILDFSNKPISDDIFDNLHSQDFWNKTEKNKICHLEVNFSASSLTDQQFLKFVQNIMNQMESLASVTLNLAKTKISSKSLQVLSQQGLKNYKLKSFVLNCSQTSIRHEGLKSLDDGLSPSMKGLENLEIVLDTTWIPGEKFLDILSRLQHLKHLKLSFENSQISSEIVSSVVSSLSSLAKNLESLDLNFNATNADDKNLENFASHAISHMQKLRHLKLSLGGTVISNEFLWDFFQNLNPLTSHLETLELDLHATELSNSSFKEFCEVLKKMKNVEHLKLDLSETKLTDASLKSLILPVRKLKSLALNLNKNKIHGSGFESFTENNNFSDIKSIHFQIGHTETDVNDQVLPDLSCYVKKEHATKAETSFEYSLETHKHSQTASKPKNRSKKNKEPYLRESSKKRKVYAELKKELLLYYGRKQDPQKSDAHRVSKLINKLSSEAYENLLTKILSETLSLPLVEAEDIDGWKKTIQTMIISRLEFNSQNPRKRAVKKHRKEENNDNEKDSSKVESTEDTVRSETVLSFRWLKKYGREISFRKKVIEIVKSMETRTFSILYQRLFDFIQELSKTYTNWKMPPNLEDMKYFFNWWYRFTTGDQELISLWKSLPYLHD